MRLTDHVGLTSNRTKPSAMTLRDVKFKFRSVGLSTLVRDLALVGEITAGGPGSGRHKEMHQELVGRGFEHKGQTLMNLGLGTRSRGVVDQYYNGDHKMYVGRKLGKWSHVPDLGGTNRTEGIGLESMQNHLDRQAIQGRQLTHYEKLTGYPLSMPIKDRTPENHLRNTFPEHFKAAGIKAGGPGSGPHPGLANLNDKELALHHAMLERVGEPNDHTAQEIGTRAKGGAMQFSPEQWKKFSGVMKTTHGIRLGNVPSYRQDSGYEHGIT